MDVLVRNLFSVLFQVAVLDFISMGSTVSLRSFGSFGSRFAVYGMTRFGSSVSVLDCVQLGSTFSLRSFGRIGSAFSQAPQPALSDIIDCGQWRLEGGKNNVVVDSQTVSEPTSVFQTLVFSAIVGTWTAGDGSQEKRGGLGKKKEKGHKTILFKCLQQQTACVEAFWCPNSAWKHFWHRVE